MANHDSKGPDIEAEAVWVAADPPSGPEPVPATEVAAGMAAVVGLSAVDVATGGLLGLLVAIPGGQTEEPPFVAPCSIEGTAAPIVRRDGTVECTRCHAVVAYSTMALNEHGYCCQQCGPGQPA